MIHKLIIQSIGEYPAARCSCGKWAFVTTHKPLDTPESKMELLTERHADHANKTEDKES